MGQSLEITCGSCGAVFSIPEGVPGSVHACPQCGKQNRAARPVAATHQEPESVPNREGKPESTSSPYWPVTWWGNALVAGILGYLMATTVPASLVGGLLTLALAYGVLMLVRGLAISGNAKDRDRLPLRPRHVVRRDACLAAALGCVISAVGAYRTTSALKSDLTTASGLLSRTQSELAEMNSLGYGIAFCVESFVRGFVGDLDGAFDNIDKEWVRFDSLTAHEGAVRSHMSTIEAKRKTAKSHTTFALVLAGVFICGSVRFAADGQSETGVAEEAP